MARLPRLTLPGYPHHIIQRGNNRQTIFSVAGGLPDAAELAAWKRAEVQSCYSCLRADAESLSSAGHAETADGLPQMMQAVGRRYVRWFNDAQGRSGTLWEGRYKSTVIDTDQHLLTCMAYLDLSPVRRGWWGRQRIKWVKGG